MISNTLDHILDKKRERGNRAALARQRREMKDAKTFSEIAEATDRCKAEIRRIMFETAEEWTALSLRMN